MSVRAKGRILAMAGMLLCTGAGADDIKAQYANFRPVSFVQDGVPQGPAIALTRMLIENLPISIATSPLPMKRIIADLKTEPFISVAIARTPDREADFIWIGELYTDHIVIATQSPMPRVDSIEDARKLAHLGVTMGSASEIFLRGQKFANLELNRDYETQLKKLQEHRTDGWCAFHTTLLASAELSGLGTANLQIGAPLAPVSIWIAASKSVPPEIIATLRQRFDRLRENGTLAALFAGLG